MRRGWCGELKTPCVGMAAGCVVQAKIPHGLGGSSKKLVTAGDTEVMTHTLTRARAQTCKQTPHTCPLPTHKLAALARDADECDAHMLAYLPA